MKTLIGGAIAAVLGIIGIAACFGEFIDLLQGAVPAMLLIGGGLAVYLGFDELKDDWKKDEAPVPCGGEDADKYKQEIEELKKEIDSLKQEKA